MRTGKAMAGMKVEEKGMDGGQEGQKRGKEERGRRRR